MAGYNTYIEPYVNNGGMVTSNVPYSPYGNVYSPFPYNYPSGRNLTPAQPQISATQPPAQISQTINNSSPFVMVPSREAAKEIAVSPNQTIYAMSQNAPEFYVKSADNMGLITTRYFKFGEFDPAVEAAQMQAQQNAPTGDFVPRSEFNQVVNQLSEQLNSVRQSLSNAPQNAIVNEPVSANKSTNKKTKETTND